MSQTPIYHADSRNAVAPTIQDEWITAFIEHGRYLRGWSPRTCGTYQQGLRTLADVPLTKAGLLLWMRAQQQRGLKPGTLLARDDTPILRAGQLAQIFGERGIGKTLFARSLARLWRVVDRRGGSNRRAIARVVYRRRDRRRIYRAGIRSWPR